MIGLVQDQLGTNTQSHCYNAITRLQNSEARFLSALSTVKSLGNTLAYH